MQEMMGSYSGDLDYVQIICISLQKDIITPAPHHSFPYSLVALPDAQLTALKHY